MIHKPTYVGKGSEKIKSKGLSLWRGRHAHQLNDKTVMRERTRRKTTRTSCLFSVIGRSGSGAILMNTQQNFGSVEPSIERQKDRAVSSSRTYCLLSMISGEGSQSRSPDAH